MWERRDLLFSAFSAKCSKKCPQLDSTNVFVINIILDPLIFFSLFLGRGESICSRTPKRVSVCRRLVQLEVLEEPSGAQTLKSLFYLYSNTMALMQSEASVHWGWDLGTSVLSTFQA